MDEADERGLDELRLEERRRYLEDRLVREEDRALAHRPHRPVSGGREPLEEGAAEEGGRLEVREVLVVERELAEEGEGFLDPGGDEVAEARRQGATEELKGRRALVEPLGEVALAHRQLVEVDQERLHPRRASYRDGEARDRAGRRPVPERSPALERRGGR